MADAQKQIKVMQSGYAVPIRVGSNMLIKCSKTECEYFNRNVYSMLDKVKEMEDKYKLADPTSLTTDPMYSDLGPIRVIAWAQKEHTKFVTEHEWPGLASTLPQSNHVKSNTIPKRVITCYHCGQEGHIKPKCPKLKSTESTGNQKAVKDVDQAKRRERTPLAAWKKFLPDDITKPFVDEKKKKWMFCTKYKDHSTGETGIFNLSHFEKDHKENFKQVQPMANLTTSVK
jgi:hypothetical protein